MEADAVAQVQATLRRRILRAFVGRGLLENFEAQEMLGYERLRKAGGELVYRCVKQHSEPGARRQAGGKGGAKRGVHADELHLTPLELIARIAALVPPPRTHRHRYFGVLAPNSPLRAAVTAMALVPDLRRADAHHPRNRS